MNVVDLETYVDNVKECAQNTSQACSHPLRIQLSAGHTVSCPCIQSGYERNTCGRCITCPRCLEQWQPETMHHAPHGSKGNYVNFPEIYIADVFYKPWYKQKTGYAIILPFDFKHGAAESCVSEDIVMAGLDVLEHDFPGMKAWITLYPIHIALYLQWKRVARRLAEWMTRRSMYFAPGGQYAEFAQTLLRTDIQGIPIYNQGNQFDHPVEALEGEHNLPYFLHFRDSYYSNIKLTNPDTWITYWMRDACAEDLSELIEFFGYIWASNSRQWCTIEGESFYSESVRNVLCRVAHSGSGATIIRVNHWQRLDRSCHIWHSLRTQCRLCRRDEYVSNLIRFDSASTPYERVLAYADGLRRRRHWGVLFCAARLLPKARAVRFVPGIGSVYKEAESRFLAVGSSRKTV